MQKYLRGIKPNSFSAYLGECPIKPVQILYFTLVHVDIKRWPQCFVFINASLIMLILISQESSTILAGPFLFRCLNVLFLLFYKRKLNHSNIKPRVEHDSC